MVQPGSKSSVKVPPRLSRLIFSLHGRLSDAESRLIIFHFHSIFNLPDARREVGEQTNRTEWPSQALHCMITEKLDSWLDNENPRERRSSQSRARERHTQAIKLHTDTKTYCVGHF